MTVTAELATEMRRLSGLVDKGIAAMRDAGSEAASAERDYRLEKSKAWASVPREHDDGTRRLAAEIEAEVNAVTADARYLRDLAEAAHQTTKEAVRARRQQLSALQTLANADRAEAEFTRTGPEMGP